MMQSIGHVPGAWEGADLPKKNCPTCGRRMRDTEKVYCTMTCRDQAEGRAAGAVNREVASLMRQYGESEWEPIS